jgi:hypothetical protein
VFVGLGVFLHSSRWSPEPGGLGMPGSRQPFDRGVETDRS